MSGDTIANTQGAQALAAHNPTAPTEAKRVFCDGQGALRVDPDIKSMSFTWNGDKTVSVIDIVKIVNSSDVTKRVTFTWSGGNLQTVAATIV